MRHCCNTLALLLAFGLLAVLVGPAPGAVVQIGPGSDISGATGSDSGGARLNIEPAFTENLSAGTYDVAGFAMNSAGNASPSGVVRPFLAKLTSSSPLTYETLWVGPQFTPTAAGIQGIDYPHGTQQFSLGAATTVYAGAYQDGTAKVRFNNTATITNHDNTPTEPTAAGQSVGDFSHAGLNNRTYAYEASVIPVSGPTSFTFDFVHPDGTGSSFSDAIPLNTVGAAKDSTGKPIGFTYLKAGDPEPDGTVNGATLTAGGLNFTTTGDTIGLGVPFDTTGSGPVTITARFSGGLTGMDTNFDQVTLGWGPAAANLNNGLLRAIVFHNEGAPGDDIVQNVRTPGAPPSGSSSNNNDPPDSNLAVLDITGASGTAGALTTAAGLYDGTNISGSINDGEGVDPYRLGVSGDSFAYFAVFGGDGFSGTLTSITFSGDDLEIPAIIPEPSTLLVWSLLAGLGVGLGWRRRRTK